MYVYVKKLYGAQWPYLDIVSEVTLCPNKDERSKGRVSPDLWDPLLRNVLERGRTYDTEAQQEHIGAGVTQRTQLVKLILKRSEGIKTKCWTQWDKQSKLSNQPDNAFKGIWVNRRGAFYVAQHVEIYNIL